MPTSIDDLCSKLREPRVQKPKSPKTLNKLPSRDTVASSLQYVNQRFCLGIEYLSLDHAHEDAQCCILYDLAHIPLDMVLKRLSYEDGVIAI